MEVDRNLIWIHNADGSSSSEAPVLASTARLLAKLRQPLPQLLRKTTTQGLDGDKMNPEEAGQAVGQCQEESTTTVAAAADSMMDDKNMEEEEGAAAAAEEKKDGSGDSDLVELEKDEEEGSTNNKEDEQSSKYYCPDHLQHLERVEPPHALVDWIRVCLQDIYQFQQREDSGHPGEEDATNANQADNSHADDDDKDKKKPAPPKKASFEERRRRALEFQRERLRLQLQLQNSGSRSRSDDQNEAAVPTEALKQMQLIQDDEDPNNKMDPWIRLARSLNSLALVTPVLRRIFRHKERNNKKLRLLPSKEDDDDGVTLDDGQNSDKNRKKRKTQCWLLGEQIFDVTTTRQCQYLDQHLTDLYAFLTDDNGSGDDHERALQQAMECLVSTYHQQRQQNGSSDHHSTVPPPPPRPWASMTMVPSSSLPNSHSHDNSAKSFWDDLDAASAQPRLSRLDEHFGLLLDRNPSEQRQHQEYLDAIQGLHRRLAELLAKRFPGSRLSIYGSCLSDLSLGKAADVDLSLHIPELAHAKVSYESGAWSVQEYQEFVKKTVFQTVRCLERRDRNRTADEFRNMVPVHRARVPVIKGTYGTAGNPHASDGSLDFDICFENDIAVANSELLREYSRVDSNPYIKCLMVVVKQWAKAHGLSSAQNNFLSSYAWMNLVVFYLQCLELVPNLQCPELMARAGVVPDPERNEWHRVNNLDTCYLTWEQAKAVWTPPPDRLATSSVTALLYGFFAFYSQRSCLFGGGTGDTGVSLLFATSIKRGRDACLPKTVFHKASFFLCIEDPFETYDSHMPHDLGMPASPTAAQTMVDCFRQAEAHLGNVLRRLLKDDGSAPPDLAAIRSLWPLPSSPPTPATNNNNRSRTGGRSASNKVCFFCHEEGHVKADCPKRNSSKGGQTSRHTKQPPQKHPPAVPPNEVNKEQAKPVGKRNANKAGDGKQNASGPNPSGDMEPTEEPAKPAGKKHHAKRGGKQPASLQEHQQHSSDGDNNVRPPPALNGSGPETSAAAAAAENGEQLKAGTAAVTSTVNHSSSGGKRDPECTLVIKNIDGETVESEILNLFVPFAAVTKTKVVDWSVSANRGIAFVDYDSTEPVLKAVDQQSLATFWLRDRKLEIYQKTAEQQPRTRNSGGVEKSGSGGRRRRKSGGGRGGGGRGREGRGGRAGR